jgi:hypothetical protein
LKRGQIASFFVAAACLFLVPVECQVLAAQGVSVTSAASVRPNTIIELRLVSKIDSRTANVGDAIDLEVSRGISQGGQIVIPKGTPVLGEVTEVKRRGFAGKGATVQIRALEICLKNGDTIPLNAARTASGGTRIGGIVLGAAAVGLIVSGVAAPLALLIPGPSSTIPPGTQFLGMIGGESAGAPTAGHTRQDRSGIKDAAASTSQPPGSAALTISTFPPAALVVIDGKTVGDAPVSARLPNGSHKLTISLGGYAPIEKEIQASGTPLKLEYVLQPSPSSALGKLLGSGGE